MRWMAVWGLGLGALVMAACAGEPSTGSGELGARLVNLGVPESPEVARDRGCTVSGHQVGSGLGSLVILVGGLERFFEADGWGDVQVVIVATTSGWPRAPERSFSLRIHEGSQTASQDFVIVEGGESGVGGEFSDITLDGDGWFAAYSPFIRLPMPIFEDFKIYPGMANVALEGRLNAGGDGFDTTDLLLMGYLTSEEVMLIVKRFIEVCGRPEEEQPVVCGLIGNQVQGDTPPEVAFPLFVSFMGGMDSRLKAGTPVPCVRGGADAATACDAISVCMEVAFEAQRLK